MNGGLCLEVNLFSMKQYIIDAFAQAPFQGNPAAVCLPEHWPDDALMQRIAAENNLSETAFVVKEGDHYRIRWFTPGYEIDLCGHATLASAFVLHQLLGINDSPLRFASQSGALTVTWEGDLFLLDFPARPADPIPPCRELSEALGIEIEELYLSRDLMAVVPDEQLVRRLRPDFGKLAALPLGDGVIVTAEGRDCDFVSRCFYPKCGVNEDPVTGSAHCNLIPYWSVRLRKQELVARQLSARGGTLLCRSCGERVRIGGKAALFSVAEILPD